MKRLSAQTFRLSNPEASERSNFQTFPVPKLPSAQTFRLFLFRSFRALKLSDFSCSEASERSNFQTFPVQKLPSAQTFRLLSSKASERSNFQTFPDPKLPSAQTFRLFSSKASERSNFQIFQFLNFRTLKLSNFHIFNFQIRVLRLWNVPTFVLSSLTRFCRHLQAKVHQSDNSLVFPNPPYHGYVLTLNLSKIENEATAEIGWEELVGAISDGRW